MVQIAAYAHAFCLFAKTIGISNTSGGIGKTELSINEMPPRAQLARACAASPIVQS